jgi:hypothetical protein
MEDTMTDVFENISILGLDVIETQALERPGVIHEVYLNLSSTPPREWSIFFEAAYESQWYSMRRRVQVSGHHIIITCGLDEIEQYHMAPLKHAVHQANAKCLEFPKLNTATATATATATDKAKAAYQQIAQDQLDKLAGTLIS